MLCEDVLYEIISHCPLKRLTKFRQVSKKYNKCPRILGYIAKGDWTLVTIQCKLPENFMREYSDFLVWKYVSSEQKFSERFLRDFIDRLDLKILSRRMILPKDIIRKHHDKLDWHWVSLHQPLTKLLIDEFQHLIEWGALMSNKLVLKEVKDIYVSRFDPLTFT